MLLSADPKTGQPVTWNPGAQSGYSIATWQFALQPAGENATRLVARQRLAYTPDMRILWRLTEPVGFVMEHRMLIGIRQRAERPA